MQAAEQELKNVAGPSRIQQLPHGLYQLVEDCFDEEQYDHALSLIDELRAESIRPSESQVRRLFALSLCSLPAHPTTLPVSNAKAPLEQDDRDAAQRRQIKLLRSRHRPSQCAISTASRLLLQLGKSWLHPTVASARRIAAQDAHFARYILSTLPSHVEDDTASHTAKRPARASASPDYAEQRDRSTPLARWMQERFKTAEDVWDLLSGGRTASPDPRSQQGRLVDEFWLSDRERRLVEEQVQARASRTSHRQPAASSSNAASQAHSGPYASASDSDSSSEEGWRASKHTAATRPVQNNRPMRTSRRGLGRQVDDEDDGEDLDGANPALRLTDGAWRTLRVLVELWQLESSLDEQQQQRGCFVDQFPPSEQRKKLLSSPWRQRAKTYAVGSDTGSSEVRKALDVAFSFPGAIPTLWWRDAAAAAKEADQDTATSERRRAELAWRRRDAQDDLEEAVQRRVEAATALLALMFAHARRSLLDQSAVIRGTAIRLSSLDADDVRRLAIRLQRVEPGMLAESLLAHLALISGSPGSKAEGDGARANGGGSGRRGKDGGRQDSRGVFVLRLHGTAFYVRRRFVEELTSADRLRSALGRLARQDVVYADVRSWIDEPANAALYRQTDVFAPTNAGGGNDDDDSGDEDEEGIAWFAYRTLMKHDRRTTALSASPASTLSSSQSSSRSTAHRVGALLRLHTITEQVRTVQIKWFVLLCLMEMHQQATTVLEDLSQTPTSPVNAVAAAADSDVTSIQAAIRSTLPGLEAAIQQDVDEVQLAIDAMHTYEEKANKAVAAAAASPRKDQQSKRKAKHGVEDQKEAAAAELPTVGETAKRCEEQVRSIRDLVEVIRVFRSQPEWKGGAGNEQESAMAAEEGDDAIA
ncbi:uncharacterized protein PFL1_01927 [Pseudozyma flocculosa PF-1]|uniref:Uncharacterized protein n=1 Tax=Pseudozyma flocculosa TaxID=84751 RepID=A0A5C3F0N1_9BASI|nr:uncharacterized protein PFL1_01927 [Pseudozyma flocculosa PF-1]EPQ30401.1 hypothetical protein PFL1_01927 [Pseudozyma flocculosa PF-1]SPO37476.1 uncharacterized protein PSFLO_02951 [Pseudozyma flocculosa]